MNTNKFSEDDSWLSSNEIHELARIKLVMESKNKDGMNRAETYGNQIWDELEIDEVFAENDM